MDLSAFQRLQKLHRRIARQRNQLNRLKDELRTHPYDSLLADRVIDSEIMLDNLIYQADQILNESM